MRGWIFAWPLFWSEMENYWHLMVKEDTLSFFFFSTFYHYYHYNSSFQVVYILIIIIDLLSKSCTFFFPFYSEHLSSRRGKEFVPLQLLK
jgi:hypothetical protein